MTTRHTPAPFLAVLLTTLLPFGQTGSAGAAEPVAAEVTPVEQVTTKPRRYAQEGLGTVAYRPSEQEQPFFAKLAADEKETGGLAGDYDISKKNGVYVGWFGIVREIAIDEAAGRTTLTVEHKYFDGFTDSHILALSFNGSGDFRAVLRGIEQPIKRLTMVKVYGKVSQGADGVPEVEAVFVRQWHWGTFTFLYARGNQRGSERWRKLNQVKLDDIYDPYPENAYFEARLGLPSEGAQSRRSLRRLAEEAAAAMKLPATAVPAPRDGEQPDRRPAGKIDAATFRTRGLEAAKKANPDAEELARPLINAIVNEVATDEALEALSKKHGDEAAVAVLAVALELDQEDARIAAATQLEQSGFAARSVVPALIGALDDENEYVRSNAVRALGEIGPEAQAAVPALIVALGDPDEHFRASAAEALGKMRVEARHVVPALILALEDVDQFVRFMTVEAIGEFGPEAAAAVEPLRKAVLNDADDNVRWRATSSLAAVDQVGKIAVPTLIEALKSKKPTVRRFAALALGRFGPQAKDAVPLLEKGLTDKDVGARIAAAGALWKVDRNVEDTVPVLVKVLEQTPDIAHLWAADEIAPMGPDAKAAVAALRKSLAKTQWPDGPAEALGNIGPGAADAVPDLEALLDSQEGQTRAHAAAALWKINRHPQAIPTLLDELKNPVDGNRYGAVEAVGQIGPHAEAGVPDLIKALSDKELYVRRAAAEALRKVDRVPVKK